MGYRNQYHEMSVTLGVDRIGYEPNEVTPKFSFYQSLVHPEDLPRVQKHLQAHLDGTTPIFECENRILMKFGNWRWNLDRGKVVAWGANWQTDPHVWNEH